MALAGAFAAQYGFDLEPCVLCIYQRWPHAVVIALAALALAAPDGPARIGLLGLAGLALLLGAGVAGYHVGVEQHWWRGSQACTASIGGAASLEELMAQIMAAPIVRCDEIAWSFLGVSMAGYNFLLSMGAGKAIAGAHDEVLERVIRAEEHVLVQQGAEVAPVIDPPVAVATASAPGPRDYGPG